MYQNKHWHIYKNRQGTAKVLYSMPWFDAWFAAMRDVIKFLRINAYRKIVRVAAVTAGFGGRFSKKKPPPMAERRWSKLLTRLQYIATVLLLSRQVWLSDMFPRAKQKALECRCRTTVHDEQWRRRLPILCDTMEEGSAMGTWGSGRPCHEGALARLSNASGKDAGFRRWLTS